MGSCEVIKIRYIEESFIAESKNKQATHKQAVPLPHKRTAIDSDQMHRSERMLWQNYVFKL